MSADDPQAPGPDSGVTRYWWVLVLGLVGALSWGTLDSPWIAEDAAILAHVSDAAPGQDLLGPQYGLHLVRFWRPVVTFSWWIQERLTGIEPVPLRLFNLLLQGLAAVLVGVVVRLLGGGVIAALLAAALAAAYPAQGGTVTWIAGRTDGMVCVLFLAALVAALKDRRWLAAGIVFTACATKEFAFVLPAWIALVVWARAGRIDRAWSATWPVALVALGALFLRRFAVDSFTGGYVGGAGRLSLANLMGGLGNGAQGLRASLVLVVCVVAVGAVTRTCNWRVVLAGLGCALMGLAPLLPLLVLGPLGPQNVRLFWVAEAGLMIAVAGALLGLDSVRNWRLFLPLVVVCVGLGLRAAEARTDIEEWSQAGLVGERAVEQARQRAAQDADSPEPLFWAGFPGTHRGAYCLGFGLADRFRPPFPQSARPIWPLRPLFVDPTRLRPRIARPDAAGFRDPFDESARRVPDLSVQVDGIDLQRLDAGFAIPIDERVPIATIDRSPRVSLGGGLPGSVLELVLLTEAGIESVLGGNFDGEGRANFSMTELCGLSNEVASIGQALFQVADLGATSAYLEARSIADDGSVQRASPPLRLEWKADLLDRLDL